MADERVTFNLHIYKDGKATVPMWVRDQLGLVPGNVLVVKTLEVHK